MPRRTSTRTVSSSATPQASSIPQQLETPYNSNIRQLRCHWKWAAFSQFFFTFSPLIAMADVTLVDVENDLAHSTNFVLPRIMQRLLIALTQDRKITTDNWQNTLRRQYQKRDPEASPIGLHSRSQHIVESPRASTAPPVTVSEGPLDEQERQRESPECNQSPPLLSPDNKVNTESLPEDPEGTSVTKIEEEDNSYGTLEIPEKQVDWLNLPMLAKLESLHTLAEWQFHNSHRLRQQMKTDDEQATWRIEPIGYDSRRNAYWLIGGDRLWIQREPPRPNLKRKRKPGGNTAKRKSSPAKRQRTDQNQDVVAQPPSTTRCTRSNVAVQHPGLRKGRAAKMRANQRLDAQARDLADFRRQIIRSRPRTVSTNVRKPNGIRVSARLRGTTVEEDEWQEVPEEWLVANVNCTQDSPSGSSPISKRKTGLESDISSISELTELSDGDNDDVTGPEGDSEGDAVIDAEENNPTSAAADEDVKAEIQEHAQANLANPSATPLLRDNFVEWETICVTLEEWEIIGQQFDQATYYAEKALCKVLTQHIVPMVTADLREAEKKRRMEEAVVHRKRSSRIAMKEFEREEERAAMRKRAEVEEKMGRTRRLEARHQREQMERLRRENAREHRRKERELRERESTEIREAGTDAPVGTNQDETRSLLSSVDQSQKAIQKTAPINGTGSGSRSPAENWELDCEICGRKGFNQDDGVPLLCCGMCGKWQHIVCHDNQDTTTGRSKRNWDAEDFVCRQCRLKNSVRPEQSDSTSTSIVPVGVTKGQVSGGQAYCGPSMNQPRGYAGSGYYQISPPDAIYSYNHSDSQAAGPPTSPHYASQTQSTGVTFAHYQPQQGGFSTSRPTYSAQDVSSPAHMRYPLTPHRVSATGITSYPSALHTPAMSHSPAPVREQWPSSSPYPRTTNSYPINGGAPLHAQGVQPYYNGSTPTSYSHVRGTATASAALGQYAGLLEHVPTYQHSK